MQITAEWLLQNGVSPAELARALGENPQPLTGEPASTPLPRRGRQNKTELRFEETVLRPRLESGEIDGFAFEALKFVIALPQPPIKACYFTPDFVAWKDRNITAFEVKGHWREAARLRIKVAAERHPWASFVAVTRNKGSWIYENF